MKIPAATLCALLGGLALTACGDKRSETVQRDDPVTTQRAADAVAADLAEDARDVGTSAAQATQEGAGVVSREFQEATDEVRGATSDAPPPR